MAVNNIEELKPMAYIEPYNGVGSMVLEHGTLLELAPGEEYSRPDQVVGKLNDHQRYPGTWVIRKSQ